jgi:hypothetical protein
MKKMIRVLSVGHRGLKVVITYGHRGPKGESGGEPVFTDDDMITLAEAEDDFGDA